MSREQEGGFTMAVTLERVEIPHRKRWTREECRHLRAAGFLPGRYELIDGEIIEKMLKNPPHRIALMLLAAWLESLFGRFFVQTQDPIVLPVPDNNSTEPEPDVAVTRAPTMTYQNDHPRPEDLLLVGEVSDTTLGYDLRNKAVLYAAAGIPDYWVLDVTGRRLYVHRRPASDGYREVRIYSETEEVSPLARPETSVLVASLLPNVFDAEGIAAE
jgi:Uma2 family endonuclease